MLSVFLLLYFSGVLAIICCFVFIFVPETSGKELPQTLDEFDMLFTTKDEIKMKDKEMSPL